MDRYKSLDLVQDAYVKAMENEEIFSYMNEYQIKGWFFKVIKNKYIDGIRKDNKITYFNDDDEFVSDRLTLESDIYIYDLINKLPERLKKVVEMKYINDLNSKEIAEKLNMSASTVRTQLSKAISSFGLNTFKQLENLN